MGAFVEFAFEEITATIHAILTVIQLNLFILGPPTK
jgi:hypothetical protein